MNKPTPSPCVRFFNFVTERYAVRERRKRGEPKPWTQDPILQRYRFCNVYREHDRVTQWIAQQVREPFSAHKNLWFMLCVARQINWPDTLQDLIQFRGRAWPHDDWDAAALRQVLLSRGARGEKVYTGAYMLNCNWGPSYRGPRDKPAFTANLVLGSVWKDRAQIEPRLHGTLQEAYEALRGHHGWGDFLVAQVIADLKYTRYLRSAPDWWEWAVLGPGSTRGLNRLTGRDLSEKWDAEDALSQLKHLRAETYRWSELPRRLCLQDTQNCLCEFDKYERVRLGEGRPRSLYPGLPAQ